MVKSGSKVSIPLLAMYNKVKFGLSVSMSLMVTINDQVWLDCLYAFTYTVIWLGQSRVSQCLFQFGHILWSSLARVSLSIYLSCFMVRSVSSVSMPLSIWSHFVIKSGSSVQMYLFVMLCDQVWLECLYAFLVTFFGQVWLECPNVLICHVM